MIYRITIIILSALAVGSLFFAMNRTPEVLYRTAPEQVFIRGEEINEFGFEDYARERVHGERDRLIREKRDFIYLDLREMTIILYENGTEVDEFEIQSKGQGLWQTPPGAYFVGDKLANHFSSIARVWMPYAVQFYGNFFVHGWPYSTGGHALPPGASGGCVRLRTVDAAIVHAFADRGMPVLVFDEVEEKLLPPLARTEFPAIDSRALLIADLDTGEILASNEIDSEIDAGPAVRMMLTLSVSEMVSLSRMITARDWMLHGLNEGLIVPGRRYTAESLIDLILKESSREAISVISRFLTDEAFLSAMNSKARSLGMNGTEFTDLANRKENTTTLRDIAKITRYMKDYRSFLLETSSRFEENGLIIEIISRNGRNILVVILDSPHEDDIFLWLDDQFSFPEE